MKITAVEEAALLQARVAGAALMGQHTARIQNYNDDDDDEMPYGYHYISQRLREMKDKLDAIETALRQL